jgi:scyllo-inositol 2-dehydrogenase (NADP+)
MNNMITTGLMAYGMSGKVFHGPFLNAHPGFKLHAVTERHHKNAEKDYPAVISYNSTDELLNDPELDLIIINTPNFTHYDFAKKALSAGKHILVEKPFTATVEEAKELFLLARQMDKKIFVYQNRRWDSDFCKVKEIVVNQTLGKLSEVHFRFDRFKAELNVKAFKEEAVAASGLQYDLGPHLLDQAISLFGKPLSFHKILGKNRPHSIVDDYFSIHLAYPDSLNVFVHANLLVTDVQPAFVLHGIKGSFIKFRADIQEEQLIKGIKPGEPGYGVEVRGIEGKLSLRDELGELHQETVLSEPSSYQPLFEAVYQSITNNTPYPITEEEIIIQLEILES